LKVLAHEGRLRSFETERGFLFIFNGAIQFLSQSPYARVKFFFRWFAG